MTDQHLSASVREWTDLLARCRFGTVRVAGKNITSSKIKEVAGRLATYADSDGTRVRPGIARIAVDLEIDPSTAKRAVQHLARIGLLHLVRAGARPGHADEYHLTIPVDLVEHVVELWSPAQHTLEVERVRESMRGRYKPRPTGDPEPDPDPDLLVPQAPADTPDLRVPQGSAQPVDNPDLRVPDAPAEPAHAAGPAGPPGTDIPGPAGAVGTDLRVPEGPATYHGPRHNPDRPDDTALRTAVTVVGHPQAEQDPLFPVVDEVPEPEPNAPSRCDRHPLPGGLRDDGLSRCALCRVEARIAAGRNLRPEMPGIHPAIVELAADGYFDDDGEPFTDEPLAPVVPIRRAS